MSKKKKGSWTNFLVGPRDPEREARTGRPKVGMFVAAPGSAQREQLLGDRHYRMRHRPGEGGVLGIRILFDGVKR